MVERDREDTVPIQTRQSSRTGAAADSSLAGSLIASSYMLEVGFNHVLAKHSLKRRDSVVQTRRRGCCSSA